MKTQIPTIHSYFSDLMIALTYMFDNKLFSPDKIKSYQFNIGNKTIQLDYKTQREFPFAILNYQTSSMLLYHDWFMHRTEIGNHSLVPILYNATKDLHLEIQEAEYEHTIDISINCESSYQLLELQHIIEVFMPLSKYVELVNFYTFIEIPNYYLNPLMFDVNKDNIYNLFLKRNQLTDENTYVAAVKYDPLIRLNSIGATGFNTDNKTFTLQMNLSIMNPVPLYFQIPSHETPKIEQSVKEIIIPDICIPLDPNIPIIRFTFDSYLKDQITINLPLINIDNNNFKTFFNVNSIQYYVSGQIKNKKYIYSATISSDEFDYPVQLTINENTNEIMVNGIISGQFLKFDYISESEIEGFFSGDYDINNLSITKFDGKLLATLDLTSKQTIYELDGLSIYDYENDYILYVRSYITIPYNKFDLNLHNYNSSRLNFIPEKSQITSLAIYNSNSTNVEFLLGQSSIDEHGSVYIICDKENTINNQNFTEHFSISGSIDRDTWLSSFSLSQEQQTNISYPVYLLMSGTFNNMPKYGASYIRNIDITLSIADEYSPVYIPDNFKMFNDFNLIHDNTENVLYNITLQNTDELFTFDETNAYLNLMPYNTYFDLPEISTLTWKLLFKKNIYTNLNSNFKLIIYDKLPFYRSLVLSIPLLEYNKYFSNNKTLFDSFFFKLIQPKGNDYATV